MTGVGLPLLPLALSNRMIGIPIPLSLSEAVKLATFSQVDAASVLFHNPALRDPK